MGVPRSLRRTFSSRSTAIEIPRDWKLVDMMPEAIIAGTYSWEAVTPEPRTASWKIDANRNRNTTGKAKVNTTCSRCRKNCLISRTPRCSPSAQAPGSRPAASAVQVRTAVVVIARSPVRSAADTRPPRWGG